MFIVQATADSLKITTLMEVKKESTIITLSLRQRF